MFRPKGGGSHDSPADVTPPGVSLAGLFPQALDLRRITQGRHIPLRINKHAVWFCQRLLHGEEPHR